MLGSAQRGELDHHHHLHHYYQQLGALNNHCLGGGGGGSHQELHHHHRLHNKLEDHFHLLGGAPFSSSLYGGGTAVEPTSVLDLWSPSPSSKGGGCCSGVSSSGGLNDHAAARLAATTAAAGSPSSFDDNRSNTSEKSVEAARRFLDQEEEQRRKNSKSAKDTAVSSKLVVAAAAGWKSGEEAAAAAARRARDKSLDEWLADLQQQKLLIPAPAEEELELTSSNRDVFFQSPPACSSSNTHRLGEIEVEIFPPPPPPPIDQVHQAHQQQYGMEELERMLLSPSSGGAATNQHHQQLAKWLLGDATQQDHHFFPAAMPAKEEEGGAILSGGGFIARDSTLFFPQQAPQGHNPSFLDPAAFAASRHLTPAIQQPLSLLSPLPRPRIVQDISLEQLFHPVDPPHFAKNAGNPGGVSDRSPSRNFQVQGLESPGWELDRKRKSPQLEHYPEIPDLSSKNRTPPAAYLQSGSSSAFAVPLAVESRPCSISPWLQRQEVQEHHRDLLPNPKLQRVHGGDGGDDRHRHGRGGSGSGGRDHSSIAFGSGFGGGSGGAPAAIVASSNPGIPSVISVPDEGLGLMDQLLHLAQAIDVGSNHVAQSILARLNQHLFCHQGKRIQRLAFYFKEALAARMVDQPDHRHPATTTTTTATATPAEIFAKVRAYTSFCEISPLLRFAYLSANQAILEAIQGEASVHIVDFDPGFGSQWAALLEDLARTPAAVPQPLLRLTLVGPDPARLGFVVESLREFAGSLHLRHTPQFALVQCAQPGEMTAPLLGLTDGEPLVVNFMFSLHRSLAARGGTDAALSAVMAASPRLVTIAEKEVDDNDGKFQRRFVETLQYYAFVLDSLGPEEGEGVLTVERDILAPGIANAVSMEGPRRTERHERLAQWRARLGRGGLEPVPVGEAARMQAECLIKGHSHGKNFEVCRDEGGLLLGWQGKPLVAVSSWTPASSSSAVEGSNHNNNSNNNNDNSMIMGSTANIVNNNNNNNNNNNKC